MNTNLPISKNKNWPKVTEDGELVRTKEFLCSCEVIIEFIDSFGKVFSPVKTDIEGNVKKLMAKYSQNPIENEYMQTMLKNEKSQNKHKEAHSANDAMLWLKRGLTYIYLLLKSLVDDFHAGATGDSLLNNCQTAYESSLKPHHNWALKKLFTVLSRAAPYRRDLYKTLSCNQCIEDKLLMEMLEMFLDGLKSNLQPIFNYFFENNMDSSQILP